MEDSLVEARIAIGSLRNSGIEHRLTWVCDGHEAMRFLSHEAEFRQAPRADLVLLDLRLPGVDGQDVLHHIREHEDERTREVAVVVMTASEDEADADYSRQHDVQAYLHKPLDVAKFLTIVEELRGYWRDDMILPERALAGA